MLDPALTVSSGAPGIALIPASVQRLSDDAELDDHVVRQVFWFNLSALFPPEPDQRRLVRAHDDPRVRAADEEPAGQSGEGVRDKRLKC